MATSDASAQQPVARTVKAFPENFPYRALTVRDGLGRDIEFYLTDADAKDDRPLILVLQGSGCTSNFTLQGDRVAGSWHAFVRRANKSRAQVLLVDKPGVKLFDNPKNPGSADECAETFRSEQSGDRWLAALGAALNGAFTLRGQKPRAILAIGHSEGAVFAARLALLHPEITHVASLAAVPASQLQDFFDMAFAGEGFIGKAAGSHADRVRVVAEAWQAVSSDPDSATRLVFGHPHRYWADKFVPFPFEQLSKSPAKFFIAYGDRDANSAPRTMDAFTVELLVRKRDLVWLRIPGVDHGFSSAGAPPGEGMAPVLERAVAWFFGEAFDRTHVIWPRT